MAKVPFSKLEVKPNGNSCKTFYYNTKSEEVYFEVKYYLPMKDKMDMVSNIINQSIDDNGFYNPLKLQVYTVLEMMYYYTNLSFTEKQKEDPLKLYDLLVGSGIFKDVVSCIYEDDWTEIQEAIITTIDNIYKYKNSAMGIMENITTDYQDLSLDASNIQQMIGDPNNLSLLKDVLTKLG